MLSSSQLVCKALKLSEEGRPSDKDFSCCLCKRAVKAGEMFEALDFGPSFSAWHTVGPSGLTCGHCAAVLKVKALTQGFKASSHVVTESGIYKLNKKAHIHHWLSNPPENEAFMINYSSAMSAHTAWGGVVNINPDIFSFTSNGRIFTLNKIQHFIAHELILEISEKINGKVFNILGRSPNIFYRIDKSMSLSDLDLFRFNPSIVRAAKEDQELAKWMAQLRSINTADMWMAACVLMYPPQPDEQGVELATID